MKIARNKRTGRDSETKPCQQRRRKGGIPQKLQMG